MNKIAEDIAAAEVLLLTTAQEDIKAIIVESVLNKIDKEATELKIEELIKGLEIDFRLNKKIIQRSLVIFAKNNYWLFKRNHDLLEKGYKKDMERVVGYEAAVMDFVKDEIVMRDKIDTAQKGLPVIKNYKARVRDELKRLSNETAKVQQNKNGKIASYVLRNYAEMTIRYEENLKDLEKHREDGINLVWTSSHADSSERCSHYQGQLFSLNGTRGEIDGLRYIPIEEAMAGINGDGNGIISGYNCRHRLIKYEKGSTPPKDYTEAYMRKQRKIDQNQRRMENSIRHTKSYLKLARTSEDKQEVERLTNLLKRQERNYKIYSFKNERAYYQWRTETEIRGESQD